MTEVWFYHLETQGLDAVLPVLLRRSLDRGWRVAVQGTAPERLQVLDSLLWTFDEASFLPHAVKGDGNAALQPVLLTDDDENPNGAALRIFIDRAVAQPALERQDYARAMLMFDGRDDEAVADARRQWSALKGASHTVTYWQQSHEGRWEKRA
ncbi:DNA polymerase III subunit chi [Lichenihabitans sp. Uapishka_5]|uniref:DNA polymerase III subunit chi n=1 Tax=Lichenihabitans sp. Uapishka_5 TaxID=3037302 RepID=UPI0029E7F6AD|nr:DNA polymerase III subunit chi [Lichenihabitans sp. Uapishka_5]MDX7950937.1 DNA polymerase III subunit chi [Lichenihabitans sp. Uapishka_5]